MYIPVAVVGDKAEQAAEMVNAGDLVLVDGRRCGKSWFDTKGEKQTALVVLAWKMTKPETTPAVEMA